jgi:osmoprotectant transport system ATP-binding protein
LNTADTAQNEGSSGFAKSGELESKAAELELRNVSKRYEGQREPAIGDLSLTVPAGEVCVLVGPSGSGKTTAMRLINRMISITGGDILLGGRSVLQRDARALRREIGYVIQQTGLFPHQTVGENIATVPGLLGWPKQRIAARVNELIELIGLDPEMTGRYPAQLSGGQRQRVGVARALAADPPLMLMDEPFGAIDPINRSRLQDEFLALQRRVKKTIVFVTHDIDEAIKMGDRIAILRDGGQLAQYDTPREILIHPADQFVAQFVGADRGIKRLSLTAVGELKLAAAAAQGDGAGAVAASVPARASVRDALSVILTAGGVPVSVVDGDGRVLGTLTLGLIEQMLAEETAEKAHEAASGVMHADGASPGTPVTATDAAASPEAPAPEATA